MPVPNSPPRTTSADSDQLANPNSGYSGEANVTLDALGRHQQVLSLSIGQSGALPPSCGAIGTHYVIATDSKHDGAHVRPFNLVDRFELFSLAPRAEEHLRVLSSKFPILSYRTRARTFYVDKESDHCLAQRVQSLSLFAVVDYRK